MKKTLMLFAVAALPATALFAQDLDSLMNAGTTSSEREKVSATFKTTRVINAQTIETTKKGNLDFRITHRFGNIATASSGHQLWGFDDSRDIRFSFDYGLSDKLSIGVGRSKMNELIDGNVKWRFLEQTLDNKVPLTIALFADAGFTPVNEASIYSNVTLPADFEKKTAHRFSYTTQLLVARKFGKRLSLELVPGYTHRNFVRAFANPNDLSAVDENDMFSAGAAIRFKLSKRVAILADYFYLVSDYRRNHPEYRDPLGIGIEMETGGHVFHITLTNASGIDENNFLPNTSEGWEDGEFKLGFSISRAFAVGKRR